MGLQLLALEERRHQDYLERFTQGDEKILAFIYRDAFGSLLHYGLQHLNDEFSVTNIIHECFLKAWDYRTSMESIPHVYRFIRMNMKWHFWKYYANNRYRFYRQTFLMERPEEQAGDMAADPPYMEEKEPDQARLERIYKVIPYLPMNRQTITQLYFEYGMGHKQIAKRFGTSNRTILAEIKKCVDSIKNMVGASEAPKKQKASKVLPADVSDALEEQQVAVYRRRIEEGQSFDEIAAATGLSREQTVQCYVQTCKLMKQCKSGAEAPLATS